MIQENPAAKLYPLLKEAKNMGDADCKNVWSTVFHIDESDISGLLKNYNSMLELYLSTKKLIEEDDRLNNERNLKYIDTIGMALSSFSLNRRNNTFVNLLTPEVMLALEYISENISFAYNLSTSLIDEDKIRSILEEIETLISKITESELPSDVKVLLVKNLFIMKESLHNYFITGIEGVRDSLERTIGSVIINGSVIAPESDNEDVKGFYKIMMKFNEIVSTVNGAKELIAPLAKIFLNE